MARGKRSETYGGVLGSSLRASWGASGQVNKTNEKLFQSGRNAAMLTFLIFYELF